LSVSTGFIWNVVVMATGRAGFLVVIGFLRAVVDCNWLMGIRIGDWDLVLILMSAHYIRIEKKKNSNRDFLIAKKKIN